MNLKAEKHFKIMLFFLIQKHLFQLLSLLQIIYIQKQIPLMYIF